MSTGYRPETPFQTAGTIVHNLHQDGCKRGKSMMTNEVYVNVQVHGKGKGELAREIAELIKDTLNDKYPVREPEE